MPNEKNLHSSAAVRLVEAIKSGYDKRQEAERIQREALEVQLIDDIIEGLGDRFNGYDICFKKLEVNTKFATVLVDGYEFEISVSMRRP